MDIPQIFKCSLCNYTSNKKFNVIRHQSSKHKENNNVDSNENKVESNEKNVESNENKVESNEKNVESSEFFCKKCNKKYLTYKSYINHENKCKGIDSLTCPTCMFHFSSKSSKSHHIKRNN